jgi:uncharacterized GH25 family protein
MKKTIAATFLAVAGFFLLTHPALACHPWFNANKYVLDDSDIIRFHIAYGHRYPFGHSFFDNAKIGKLFLITPEGKEQTPGLRSLGKGKTSQIQYESKVDLTQGTHLLVMEAKGNFGAYTEKGYQRKSKKELAGQTLKGPVSYAQSFCKALVNVGGKGGGQGYAKVLSHGLEIVPLKDPADLRTNDILPVQVLHNGNPLDESVMVHATYMGFSTEADVFAYTAWASSYREGEARIRLMQPGVWMLFVNHKLAYPDSELADRFSYQATLTFEVKP